MASHIAFSQTKAKEFCNSILNEMCYYPNVKKLRTTPYHPQTNGAVERVHQTLKRMIGKLDNKCHRKWIDHLGAITHSYNSTRSQVTGYSPYFLMFGCRPRLPVNLLFPTYRQLPKTKGVNEFVKALYSHLCEVVQKACISADQEAAQHKRLYDCRAGVAELCTRDRVLVCLDAYRGTRHKLKNRWGSELHMVVGWIADDVPAYVIRNDDGNEKVLHWAQLLLWSSVDEEEEGLQVTVARLAIFISGLELEPLAQGEKRSRVPYEWSFDSFSLSLASLELKTDAPELKTGPDALATPAEAPQKGVGQRDKNGKETISMGDGDAVLVEDAPP